jgi:aminoglycoside 6'-N-acetyltransferase I
MPKNSVAIIVRPVAPADSGTWECMRCDLWPDDDSGHAKEIASFFAGMLKEPTAVLVAEITGGKMIGFVELSLRTDVLGLEGKQVGYVEGLYVARDARWQGVAKTLLHASRNWAREQKCKAFASDRAGRIIIDKNF